MSNLARLLRDENDVLTLDGVRLEKAIARELGYRQGRELLLRNHEEDWYAPSPGKAEYQPLQSQDLAFSTNAALLLPLPLPGPTDCCEDWIHTEMGPQGRWIVRLVRFYRPTAAQPWKSKELYVADRDDDQIPLATAYGRAWLFSHTTWPAEKHAASYDEHRFAGKPAA